jgi:hypothetical protein
MKKTNAKIKRAPLKGRLWWREFRRLYSLVEATPSDMAKLPAYSSIISEQERAGLQWFYHIAQRYGCANEEACFSALIYISIKETILQQRPNGAMPRPGRSTLGGGPQ